MIPTHCARIFAVRRCVSALRIVRFLDAETVNEKQLIAYILWCEHPPLQHPSSYGVDTHPYPIPLHYGVDTHPCPIHHYTGWAPTPTTCLIIRCRHPPLQHPSSYRVDTQGLRHEGGGSVHLKEGGGEYSKNTKI